MTIFFPFFLILAVADAYLLIRAFREWWIDLMLPDYGTLQEACITRCRRQAARPASYYYYVAFSFDLDGRSYEAEQMVSKATYLRLHPGAFVNVAYLPRNPKMARLTKEDQDKTGRNAFTFGAIVMTIITLLALIMSFK